MKKEKKFQIGDKVVVIRQIEGSITLKKGNWKIGDTFVIVNMFSYQGNNLYSSAEKDCACYEDELELEQIYNSPLYRALS